MSKSGSTKVLGDYQDMFLDETVEQLEELNQAVLRLEENIDDKDCINEIFRVAHTIKSSSAFVGLEDLSALMHKMENIFQGIRDDKVSLNKKMVNLLFECFDKVNELVTTIAEKNEVLDMGEDLIRLTQQFDILETLSDDAQETPAKPQSSADAESGDSSTTSQAQGSITAKTKETVLSALARMDNVFLIKVELEPGTMMPGLRLLLVYENLRKAGCEILWSSPSENDLEEGTSGDRQDIRLLLVTEENRESLKPWILIDMVAQARLKQIDSSNVEQLIKTPKTAKIQKPDVDPGANISPIVGESTEPDHVPGNRGGIDSPSPAAPDKKENKGNKAGGRDEKNTDYQKSVRVSTQKIDQMINEVGELVIANSGFQRIYDEMNLILAKHPVLGDLKSRIDQMSRIARQLQDVIMKTRMFPIGPVFNRFKRAVRDLAEDCGKKVTLEIKGENTELDKEVIDKISDPLLHLIRNAIDHGIEKPEMRQKLGKEQEATLVLNAYQSGNQIVIEISEDGQGLDAKKILQKAIARGLVSRSDSETLNEHDIFELILEPGFSTKDEVSDLSGRGVGMDVVSRTVSEFGGEILIESVLGKGTTFSLVFPLTLAIISSIMIQVGNETYAVPLSDVQETIKINRSELKRMENQWVTNLRGDILPVYGLNELLDVVHSKEAKPGEVDEIAIVVVQANKRKAGLIVDDFLGKQEIVIKNIEKNYRHLNYIAGAVIMGDGNIILILDTKAILYRFGSDKAQDSNESNVFSGINDEQLLEFNQKIVQLDKDNRKWQFRNQELINSENNLNGINGGLKQSSNGNSKSGLDKNELESLAQLAGFDFTNKSPSTPVNDALSGSNDFEAPVSSDSSSSFDRFDDEMNQTVTNSLSQQQLPEQNLTPNIEPAVEYVMTVEDRSRMEKVMKTSISNAGMVLSQLLGQPIELKSSVMDLIDASEVLPLVKDKIDVSVNGILVSLGLAGAIGGTLIMFFSTKSANKIAYDLMGIEDGATETVINPDTSSALMEITNILGASVVNSIADKANLELHIDVPKLEQISLQKFIDRYQFDSAETYFINTEFCSKGDETLAQFFFMPDQGGFQFLLKQS